MKQLCHLGIDGWDVLGLVGIALLTAAAIGWGGWESGAALDGAVCVAFYLVRETRGVVAR